jgi:hypothetical protein
MADGVWEVMDRQLTVLSIFTYSLSNLISFCAITYPDARGGCLIMIGLMFLVIFILGFMNHIKLVQQGQTIDGMYFDPSQFVVGFAPSLFFGCWYLIGVISGVYLGWR